MAVKQIGIALQPYTVDCLRELLDSGIEQDGKWLNYRTLIEILLDGYFRKELEKRYLQPEIWLHNKTYEQICNDLLKILRAERGEEGYKVYKDKNGKIVWALDPNDLKKIENEEDEKLELPWKDSGISFLEKLTYNDILEIEKSQEMERVRNRIKMTPCEDPEKKEK